MKPSKFKIIEKKALKQRTFIKGRIENSILLKDIDGVKQNRNSLDNLITTMKSLKKTLS